ncbi:TonB-dependent siderophore receptor [Acinetobacter puyangensis]|uniref:Outer-membrane receptor for ferric coprogen and ferric-rhodotorulic acid n=1 Tax=Acinetobacter puyangensis TaxID=1096779 RepID=A0A240EFH9_9GAMM|nr:TonB-dependent receptor [Acinetobacter puyangensis]SNX46725.1 outer-membrane receptor for ferric coprogen and ferric-rhodotorulic acid [Acinetobacter puyangensis]
MYAIKVRSTGHHPLFNAIRTLMFGAVLGLSATSYANTTDSVNHYEISAGQLGQALSSFALQSGIALSFDPALTQGLTSSGLTGSYTTAQGFAQLLKGTNLQLLKRTDGSWTLEKVTTAPQPQVRDMGQLKPIDVNASGTANRDPNVAQLPVITVNAEDENSYTVKNTSTATKLNLSLRETPQSVSVITRQQIEDLGLTTLNDAVLKTIGLSMQKTGAERYSFYARGFDIDAIMYDGLPTSLASAKDALSSANLAMYERIEIVRGANGLVQGSGNPSAAINLVRKKPTTEFQSSIGLSAGSWDNYHTELDVSGSLAQNGKIRGRAVATYEDADSFQDKVNREHSLFYATVEADVTDSTTVTVSYTHHNENNNVAWGGGLPTAVDGSDLHLSRSTSFLTDWDHWDKEMDTVSLELDHHFANDWKLRISGSKNWAKFDYLGGYPGRLASNLSTLSYRVSGGIYDDTQNSFDVYLNGPFQLFNRTHELVFGYSYQDDDFNSHGSGTTAVATITDPSSFDTSSWVKPTVNFYDFIDNRDMTQHGVYTTARFSILDQLKFISGVRLNWYDYQYVYNWKGSISNTQSKETAYPTFYSGIIYDLNQQHSIYASYTDIFQPQSSRDASGQLLESIKGKNYEIGIKGEYFDGALNASMAIFHIDQDNRAKEVSDPTACSTYPSSTCYEAAGLVQSKGFEVEINGEITPNWQVAAGYSYIDAKYKKDSDNSNIGKLFDTDIPKHQVKVSTMYHLPNALYRWRVGGNFSYQSGVYNEGTTSGQKWKIEQGGYSVFNLTTGYRASEKLDLQFALNNIFDKTYYQTIGQNISSWPTIFYGAPRNFMATLKYNF